MFRESSTGCEGDWTSGCENATTRHHEIDRQLRRLAKQRAGLDAEEARWLRRADEANVWRALGYVHALEYLEDVFGYAPRTAQERLRVARELGQLPMLEAELDGGNMPYSIVRGVTRVATPETEASWIEKARGRNYRQVEQLLAGRKKGDEPTDEAEPMLVEHDITLKLDASTRALLRETRAHLEKELGHAIDDATFIDMVCRRAIEERGDDSSGDKESKQVSRPGTMIHLTTCRHCKASMQHGAGVSFPLTKAELERAECDAIIVDDERGKRAASEIPPAMRRQIFERDQYRCRFPGCRSARNLDIHHVEHQEHGGDHSSGNLGTVCRGHHKLNHDGVISISGDADGELVFIRNGVVVRGEEERGLNAPPPRVVAGGLSRYREVERNTLAKSALQQAGYKSSTAARAVERAAACVPPDAALEVLLKESFRHCD